MVGALGERCDVKIIMDERLGISKSQGDLGFQDPECFNTNLLVKQRWRLLQNSNTLVCRIFKEKYYPNSTFWKQNWVVCLLMHGEVYGFPKTSSKHV